jgi:hypothetical protein
MVANRLECDFLGVSFAIVGLKAYNMKLIGLPEAP